MFHLYGRSSSINVRKVMWLLDLLELPYDHTIDLDANELSQMTPHQLVPVLTDDELVIWESNSILRYLASSYGTEDSLYPKDPKQRVHYDMWLDWQATNFNAAWNYAFQAVTRKNPAYSDQALTEKSKQDWNHCIALLDDRMSTRTYMVGERFSIVDIVIGLSLNRWYESIGSKGTYLHIDDYFAVLANYPSFDKVVMNGTP